MKDLLTQQQLIQFIKEEKTAFEIAKSIGCCKNTIKNYLKKYNLATPRGFYATGKKIGRPKGIPCSQRQKDILSKKFSGSNNPFYGKKHSDATRKKMSENHADFTGENHPLKKAINKDNSIRQTLSNAKQKFWSLQNTEDRYKITKKCILGDISKGHWSSIKGNAKTRNLEFNITPEQAWDLWINQNGTCALSGVDLNLKSCYEITASLDRIDSSKGYKIDNIQWIHKIVNIMKGALPENDFIQWCTLIIEHNYDKKSKQ